MSGVALCHFITHVPDIKWGIVDFYGEKKISFDYLKRTYQPILPSLEFSKRRWDAGSEFTANLWIVNDYQYKLDALTLEWEVRYQNQATTCKGTITQDISSDSANKLTDLKWSLPKDAEGEFEVVLSLKDQQGNEIANNHYVLLVGNQEQAKQQSLAYLAEAQERLEQHGHCVYRYWPEMWDNQ